MSAAFMSAVKALNEADQTVAGIEGGNRESINKARDICWFLWHHEYPPYVYGAVIKALRTLAEDIAARKGERFDAQ